MASIGPRRSTDALPAPTPSAHLTSLLPNPVSPPTQHWTLVPPRFREYATQTLVTPHTICPVWRGKWWHTTPTKPATHSSDLARQPIRISPVTAARNDWMERQFARTFAL